jgi:hypothetical protein
MKRTTCTPASKGLIKDQVARPRAKRKVIAADQPPEKVGDPFALFTEWSSDADERAFADLG